MVDPTAGRSAGSWQNPRLDPTRPSDSAESLEQQPGPLADPTAGGAAGTAWNTAQDPTRPVT